jgi:hypothetical protein
MAINFKNPLTNPQGFFSSEPGGFFAAPKGGRTLTGLLGDERVNIGLAIAQGQPIGKAILGGALQANTLQETFGKQNLKKKIADGTATKQDYISLYPELAAKQLFADPKETFRPMTQEEKILGGYNPDKNYNIGSSGKISQVGGGDTNIDLGGKTDLEFAKKQLSQVGTDIEKTAGFVNKSQAINRIEAGLDNFQTGAFGEARSFIGNVAETFGVDTTNSKFFNPEGQLITSGAAEFKRILASGLQNLNREELKMLTDINPQTGNTPYVNRVIVETMKINNKVDQQTNELGKQFLAQEISFKEYNAQIKQFKKDATKESNEVFDAFKTLNEKLPKIVKDNIGASVTGINVQSQKVPIKISNSDKWTGQKDLDGNLLMRTINGDLYSVMFKD